MTRQSSNIIWGLLSMMTTVTCAPLPNTFACGNYGVTCSDGITIDKIDLYDAYRGGTIPTTIGSYTGLTYLSLFYNSLTGTIPSQISLLTGLTYLSLSSNSLMGTIPNQISLLTNIQYLYLYENSLTGTIPSQISLLSYIQNLVLYLNSLTGTIPTQLSLFINIKSLYLSDNSLMGTIPSQLSLLTGLTYLGLSYNSLTGTIPNQLLLITNIQELYLDNNSLCGPVPVELSSICPLDYCLSYDNADIPCASAAPTTPLYLPTYVPSIFYSNPPPTYVPSVVPSNPPPVYPAVSPSLPSQPSASSSDIYGLLDCFAADEMLEVEDGEKLPISTVKVGLKVLSSSRDGQLKYAAVIAVPHSSNSIAAVFVHISTASTDIKLTGSHLLLAGPCHLTASFSRADALAVGDCIVTTYGYEQIAVATVGMGRGVYSVVTTEELVVVGGVIASPFANNHFAAHTFYDIHRFLYAIAPAAMETRVVAIAVELWGSLLKLIYV